MAIQTAGYRAIRMDDLSEEYCKGEAKNNHFGAQWLTFDGNGDCWAFFRPNPSNSPPYPNSLMTCDWALADHKWYDTLEKKYHINSWDYVGAAYRCIVAKREKRMPYFVDLPLDTDNKPPVCWLNIPTGKAKMESTCPGNPDHCVSEFRLIVSDLDVP
ncbi:hypothetical protein K458DRAFT_388420 [Lentithecium fluviatile CBS 122367]|uniref:Uncharacterized protein n=1 Tax=Lentithecium fluviatile CBS 122367 TaxID=1168545 RepID=A0A6G1J3D6_9PLEO|nr:hypothetical protein K458DRAFT_388420 [Lentithecium fluviatile CBS 122367]